MCAANVEQWHRGGGCGPQNYRQIFGGNSLGTGGLKILRASPAPGRAGKGGGAANVEPVVPGGAVVGHRITAKMLAVNLWPQRD